MCLSVVCVERLASEREECLAQGLVLRWVCVDEWSNVLWVCFPVNDELTLTDQLTNSRTNHVDTNNGTILLANQLDEALSVQDLGLAVTSKVVLDGFHVLGAKLLNGGLFGDTNRADFWLRVRHAWDAGLNDRCWV